MAKLPLPYKIEDEAIQGNFDELAKQFPLSKKHMKLEAAHVVGASDEPAFQNSWVNYDTSTYHGARFWKDASGIVHIEGLIKSGTVGTTVFVLPEGYRPSNGHIFNTASNTGAALALSRVDVGPTGNVVMVAGNNTYISLSGISFRQEQ